ncbi:methylenetetrahydrofolate reductase [NAD(P)H] [Nocardioides nematodiphilus]|uniref:methylenetetrahydrofolate reductase [NAD(P)H] n=1 Tax=Nocardioides nematodiphilus TaxID=2849669 RepID=UPI001CD93EE1|nr:methylenetetrahydrofolate reductase [NAD(P)H] [Nocardioides nematodiphilus]MCA1982474.1 methylenetetrahydrofolate reductase [NAD(P)H] [Nocardioides nematodiphilus]
MVDPISNRIAERLRTGERSFSFEFFPPKDEAGEEQLWKAIEALEPYAPSFVSVTYGAGGSSRDNTIRVTSRIARETSLLPMAHLTIVGHTVEEIDAVLDEYAASGIENVLLLRGDPKGGPTQEWTPTPGGLSYAGELVERVAAQRDFGIGVAAFPERHPASPSIEHDADILAAKARAGAGFAITQMFYRCEDYFALVERVRERGVDIPILPGIMPILNLAAIKRQGELIGTSVPDHVVARIEKHGDDAAAVRAEGIAIAAEMCEELLAGGAPGLHFITLNRSTATLEIFDRLNVQV